MTDRTAAAEYSGEASAEHQHDRAEVQLLDRGIHSGFPGELPLLSVCLVSLEDDPQLVILYDIQCT